MNKPAYLSFPILQNKSYNILMTIYALSSGPGVSGVAIIRISGSETSKSDKIPYWKRNPKAKSGYPSKNKQYQHF